MRGIDLNMSGEPVPGLRLLGGLTFLDSEQTRTAGGVNQGKEAFGVPTMQLNPGANWTLPPCRA